MIDNKERQEIVNNLRASVELRKSWENVPEGLLLDILAADLHYDHNKDFEPWLFTHLAELIERKTCHNLSQDDNTFVCSNCKAGMYIVTDVVNEYGELFNVPFLPRYCPNCEAEVAE